MDLHLLKQAILEYREEGKRLMAELGRKYGLDITVPEEYSRLISRSNQSVSRKGALSDEWNYAFHGHACGFYHRKSRQTVEVVLGNAPEFGELDAWFLMQYMESTEKYRTTVERVHWLELKPAIQELYANREIECMGADR